MSPRRIFLEDLDGTGINLLIGIATVVALTVAVVKLSPLVETYDAEMLSIYGQACGWVLARAHAKAGDPWAISGYLGKKSGQFDEAMGEFALAYADQAEREPRSTARCRSRRHRRGAAGALSAGLAGE